MDKKKLITKIIFGKENLDNVNFPVDENIKDNFEIAWDVAENFEEIKKDLLSKLFKDLKQKIEKDLPMKEKGFIISKSDWGSLYISKEEWIEKGKKEDRGIYAVAIEKRNKNEFTIGIVKNADNFKTSKEEEIKKIFQNLNYRRTQWWIGYIPLEEKFLLNDREFFPKLLQDYNNVKEILFAYVKKVYENITQNPDLLKLLDESVKERKKQLENVTS
ncbi:hypothetical protein [Persephonella sp.]